MTIKIDLRGMPEMLRALEVFKQKLPEEFQRAVDKVAADMQHEFVHGKPCNVRGCKRRGH